MFGQDTFYLLISKRSYSEINAYLIVKVSYLFPIINFKFYLLMGKNFKLR